MCVYVYTYIYIHIHIYIHREREREKDSDREGVRERETAQGYKGTRVRCPHISAEIEHASGAASKERAAVGGTEFFGKFRAWGRAGNYSTIAYTISRFGTEMGKLVKELAETDPSQDALVKCRAGGGVCYQVNWTQLKAHLQGTGRYDPDAAL